MESPQNHLETWAVVELFGHQKEIGFVTTVYYGTACMFRVDVPELPEREEILVNRQYSHELQQTLPVGTVVKIPAKPGRTRLVGVSALYAISPCDEATARAELESMTPRPLELVRLPANLFGPVTPESIEDEEAGTEDFREAQSVLNPPRHI